MTAIALRDGVHLAWSGDIAIFLDLDADRYSCLSPGHSAVLHDRMQTHVTPDTSSTGGESGAGAWLRVADALMHAGLARSPTDGEAVTLTASGAAWDLPPARAALSHTTRRPDAVAVARLLLSRARMRRRLRSGSLRALVANQKDWTARAPALSPAGRGRVLDVAAWFQATRGVYASKDKCLAEALALTDALRARGLHAHWVFGVSAPPFEAHCWVQSGDLVLNDTLDHVRRYTPILVA